MAAELHAYAEERSCGERECVGRVWLCERWLLARPTNPDSVKDLSPEIGDMHIVIPLCRRLQFVAILGLTAGVRERYGIGAGI